MTSQVIAWSGLQSPTLQVFELAGAGSCNEDDFDRPAYGRYDDSQVFYGNVVSFRSSLYVSL